MNRRILLSRTHASVAFIGLLTLVLPAIPDEPVRNPIKVKIRDDRPVVVEAQLPIEPQQHAQVSGQNNMMVTLRVDSKTMHLGAIQTVLKIDGQIIQPGNFPGRTLVQNQPLPQKAGKRRTTGFYSVYEVNKVQITQLVEVVPTKPAKGASKRRLDAMMVRYLVDNKDNRPHQVGVRVWMDMFLVNNDGALFAAPNRPGKVLDGVEMRDKDVPDYLQVLQRPDVQNPGYVAHFTYHFGKAFE